MTTIIAKAIEKSASPADIALTTLQLRYPLIIHAESRTHRRLSETGEVEIEFSTPGIMDAPELSRNGRSARAVPIDTIIQEVLDDPFVPIHWGKTQRGMVAEEEVSAELAALCRDRWLRARDDAVEHARFLAKAGLHKQVTNRVLAPFMHIDTLVSATEWNNFFALRDHPTAEPHMRMLAEAMKKAIADAPTKLLQPGEWHLPYITGADWHDARVHLFGGMQLDDGADRKILTTVKKMSVARCARISYEPFDGDGSIEAELRRFDLLVGSAPVHASPAEHQATPDVHADLPMDLGRRWAHPGLHGNLTGWCQFRKSLPFEWVPG